MKKIIYLASIFFLASCGADATPVAEEVKEPVTVEVVEEVEETVVAFSGDATLGETLFKDNGCVVCHHPTDVVIGPSLATVSAGYTDNGDQIVSFLKEESEAIIDPAQYEVMKANLGITKEMSDDQLKAIAAFILQH